LRAVCPLENIRNKFIKVILIHKEVIKMVVLLLVIIASVLLFGKEETKSTIGAILATLVILGLIGMLL